MNRAYIICRDVQEHYFTLIVEKCVSLDAAKTIADFLETQSAAKIVAFGFVQEFAYRGKAAQETGHYDRVAQQLRLSYQDPDADDRITFIIPAPLDDVIDADQEANSLIVAKVETLLSACLNIATLKYMGGGLRSHIIPKPIMVDET